MLNLPLLTWERFGIWMGVGVVVYFAYGFWKSRLRRGGEHVASPQEERVPR
jgi:APA family basic amino acid/polyamine antiporter